MSIYDKHKIVMIEYNNQVELLKKLAQSYTDLASEYIHKIQTGEIKTK